MPTMGSMVRVMSANSLVRSFTGAATVAYPSRRPAFAASPGSQRPDTLPSVRARRSGAQVLTKVKQHNTLTSNQPDGGAYLARDRNVFKDAEAGSPQPTALNVIGR